ncbi:Autophagy protein 22 [Didymosphaeria variabile]|uniref:Autophagy-related protein n=1 Tax=Didymosphaeria variabile TaxID=1932322 RepID=A0A9W8XIL6_9PLEO|nr:Autophagy protein 22 [Didymosphaeria variabile]KAJ4351644.1 Autophagy protein 22 [Didymosphaeria variabile]
MSLEDAVRPSHPSRYHDEDTSPTTQRELRGWYSYAIAAEVFAVVGVGLFLPVLLEQLPRERGVLFSDSSKPCVDPPGSGDAGRFRARAGGSDSDDQCIVRFLGSEVTTTSFAMYTTSAAVLFQAITLICFSSFADYGPYRKKLLLTFAYTGATVCSLFVFITSSVYFLAPFLVVIGVTCLGSGFSLLNAFLPLLVSNHPSHGKSFSSDDSSEYELEGLNRRDSANSAHSFHPDKADKLTEDLERSSKISSKGVGLGYASAVGFQFFSVGVIIAFDKLGLSKGNPTLPMRVILFLVGIWWALFTIPTLLWLRPRPGPPLPTQPEHSSIFTGLNSPLIFYLSFSVRSFWNTLRRASRLRQTLIFLAAWFLLSDAVATISGTAILFARTELHMGTIPLVFLSLTSIGFSMIGAFLWPRVAAHYALSPKTVLIACTVGMEIIPLYGLLGYIPIIKTLGVGGIQKPFEIYPIGVIHGLVMGGISSYARSVYAPLIPEGSEAAFFALYAVTDKGSSAVGPALVGWIVNRAGTIRPAFIFLAILVVLPGPLLWWLDVEKGREEASRLAGERDAVTVGGYARVGEDNRED